MQREYFLNAVVGLSVVATVAAVGPRLSAQEVEKEIHRIVVKVDADGEHDATKDGDAKVGDEREGDEQKSRESADRIVATLHASPFWIGAECIEANDALRSQLNLDEDRGLVVLDIVADSPAAKAGLKKHDVIVTVGEQPIGKASELVKAVDAAKEGELKLGVLRAGKSETITVKPEKRKTPGEKHLIFDYPLTNVRMVRPGTVLPKGAKFNIKIQPFRAALPADMTVTITKTGKEIAKIAVKQGEKTWETTADKLGELPEEVRKQIEPMMMALPFPHGDRDVITFVPYPEDVHNRLHEEAEAFEKARRAAEETREKARDALEKVKRQIVERGERYVEEGKRIGVEQIDRRLEALSRQIDSLRKSVEQLKADSKKE